MNDCRAESAGPGGRVASHVDGASFCGVHIAVVAERPELLTIAAAALLGRLGDVQLLLVTFGVGACVALGEVAGYAYVPTLVDRHRLVEANSRIQVSYSVAESAGPGVGGALVQLISGSADIVVDTSSFFWSAWMTLRIGRPEPAPVDGQLSEPLLRGIAQGWDSCSDIA